MKSLLTILTLFLCGQLQAQKTISWTNLDEIYDTATMQLKPGKHFIIARIGINRKIRFDTIGIQIMGDTSEYEVNYLPIVDAGADTSFTYRKTGYLKGAAVDRDGVIKSYKWDKVSGPTGKISYPTRSATTLTSLQKGQYVFRLTATDDKGGSASRMVNVTVK